MIAEPAATNLERLEQMDPLVISDDAGNVIFRLKGDGTAVTPDPSKLKLAAAIFWREVLYMADTMGIPVAFTTPESGDLMLTEAQARAREIGVQLDPQVQAG